MASVVVGACQTPVTGNKESDLITAQNTIARCAQQGAEIVVLPEMFCCPYSNRAFPDYAEEAGGRVWRFLSDMALRYAITLVGGSFPEKEDGKLYNTCFIFDKRGEQIGRHRKMHLFDIDIRGGQSFRESDTLAAGNDITVIETSWGKIGVMICFDLRIPELARLLAAKGAQAIIVPASFNMTTGPAHWELTLRARAVDNQLYLLACAPARDEQRSYVSYANSLAVSPWGDVQARLGAEEGILITEFETEKIKDIRGQLPLLSALRSDIYQTREL